MVDEKQAEPLTEGEQVRTRYEKWLEKRCSTLQAHVAELEKELADWKREKAEMHEAFLIEMHKAENAEAENKRLRGLIRRAYGIMFCRGYMAEWCEEAQAAFAGTEPAKDGDDEQPRTG